MFCHLNFRSIVRAGESAPRCCFPHPLPSRGSLSHCRNPQDRNTICPCHNRAFSCHRTPRLSAKRHPLPYQIRPHAKYNKYRLTGRNPWANTPPLCQNQRAHRPCCPWQAEPFRAPRKRPPPSVLNPEPRQNAPLHLHTFPICNSRHRHSN